MKSCSVKVMRVRGSRCLSVLVSAVDTLNNVVERGRAGSQRPAGKATSKSSVRPPKPTGYPRNWGHLRLILLRAAAYVCQEQTCGVHDFAEGWRHFDGAFTEGSPSDDIPGARFITIRLALTHLDDPTPSNCEATNLRIRCQRCHNVADAEMRREHARSRRHAALAISDLFA